MRVFKQLCSPHLLHSKRNHIPPQLEKQEKQTLSLIRKVHYVEVAYRLAQQFVTLFKERNAQPLETWLRLPDERDQRSGHFCGIGLEKEGSGGRSINRDGVMQIPLPVIQGYLSPPSSRL